MDSKHNPMAGPSAPDPFGTLEAAPGAGEEEIRAAYLRQIQLHPPDRDPDAFERIRDAYEFLRNPRHRIHAMLFQGDPLAPLESLAPKDAPGKRSFLGPAPWLRAMKECK